MIETLSETIRTARKDHECMSCLWLKEVGDLSDLTFTELRSVAKAKANNYKILKGQTYSDCRCKSEGEIYVFRSIPEIHNICAKYKFYPE